MTTLPHADPATAAGTRSGRLALPGGHVMYCEDRQRPSDRLVALVLHGGPGSSISPRLCRQIQAAGPYRVISFDQRGCGLSLPRGSTEANTTEHLVADIERLRERLGISRWLVVGGSWGATLAMAYASRHRHAVSGLLLRGLFVPSASEIRQFFHRAMSRPSTRQPACMPTSAQHEMLPWLHDVFHGRDAALQSEVAPVWHRWEQMLSGQPEPSPPDVIATAALVDRYRVQSHYLMHECWLGAEGLRRAAADLRGVPTVFLHGLRDEVCSAETARLVQLACPGSEWIAVADAGHDPFAQSMARAMDQCLRLHAQAGTFTAMAAPA